MKKTHKSTRHLKHASSSRQFAAFGLFVIILLGLLAYRRSAIVSTPWNNNLSINEVGTSAGKVDLMLTPSSQTVDPGVEEFILTLTADAHEYQVGDIAVELTYDPAKVGTPVLTQGTYLTDKMGTPKVENGKITFEYVSPIGGNLASGTGTVATIKLFPKGSGSTTIAFTENTEVVAFDPTTGTTIPSNMLKSAGNSVLNIQSSVDTSPSPAAAVSPSPDVSPSPSATAARPAKPTGLRHNCFDGGNKITLRWDAVSGVDSYKLRLNQKDGDADKSVDNIKVTEGETSIIPDQKYSWWVHSSKDGIDSEEAKIDEIICQKTTISTTTTQSPSPTAKATLKPTVKPTIKPSTTTPGSTKKISAEPQQSISPTASLIPISQDKVGSLNDIFADKDALKEKADSAVNPNFFQRIALGWQAIFNQLAQIFQ